MKKVEDFFVNTVGASTLSNIVIALSVFLAFFTGLNTWVTSIVRRQADSTLLSEVQNVSKTQDNIKNNAENTAEVLKYAAQISGSPRIHAEWLIRKEGGQHRIKITNNDSKTFNNVEINFLTKFRIFTDTEIVSASEKPIYHTPKVNSLPFRPGTSIEAVVPELNHDFTNVPDNIIGEKISTDITIRLDEFVSIRDDIHSIKLYTTRLRSYDFKPQYGTSHELQPLFIYKELKYLIQSQKNETDPQLHSTIK